MPPFGRYRVDLDALDRGQAVVVDEIGPMEICSPRLRDAILQILEAEAAVVGTIVLRSQSFADRVKAHPSVTVPTIAAGTRDDLPGQILSESGLPPCASSAARP